MTKTCLNCAKEFECRRKTAMWCSSKCKFEGNAKGIRRAKPALDDKQAAMRARVEKQTQEEQVKAEVEQQKEDRRAEALKPYHWPKGVTGNFRGRGLKKVIAEYLKLGLDFICPDEWLVSGLEGLKGSGPNGGNPTVGEVFAFRLLYHGATGTKNPGLPSAVEVVNRTEGKVPLPVVAKEPEREGGFTGFSDEELDENSYENTRSSKAKNEAHPPLAKSPNRDAS